MSQWAEFNLQTLFPGPVAEATEQVGNVCEQIGATAETIASAIETLANILVDVTDPLRAVIQELITLLEETMSDVLHTGLYFYYDCAGWPFYQVRSFDWDKIKQAMAEGEAHGADIREGDVKPEDLPLGTTAIAYGWPGWQARWKKSLDDLGDIARPIFSDNAEVGAIFLVAGTLGPLLPFGWAVIVLGALDESPEIIGLFKFGALDLLLDADGDLAVSVTGDLALTPRGSVCLLQDIADLLETLPGDLFGHPEYGAGIGRLFGENYKAGFVRHVERAVRDALVNDPSVAPRLLPETVQVDMERYSERELSVAINVSAISDGQIVPLNFVWQYGLDDVSRIFTREAAR